MDTTHYALTKQGDIGRIAPLKIELIFSDQHFI